VQEAALHRGSGLSGTYWSTRQRLGAVARGELPLTDGVGCAERGPRLRDPTDDGDRRGAWESWPTSTGLGRLFVVGVEPAGRRQGLSGGACPGDLDVSKYAALQRTGDRRWAL
jgi:hypothetical protein